MCKKLRILQIAVCYRHNVQCSARIMSNIQNCPHTLHNHTQWSAHRAHIAVVMLAVHAVKCTLHITWCAHSGHCSENGWCARDRKWRRGVRAVASWTPARAQLAHCVLSNFCTICATFSRQYQGLAHCCAVIETRHLRRFEDTLKGHQSEPVLKV